MSEQEIVTAVLAQLSEHPETVCRNPALHLERDLGIDSLLLAEMVEILQQRAGIVVPDEVTARLRTVDDVQQAVRQLRATQRSERP